MALAAVSLFWGTTYLGIRVAMNDLPPFFLSGFRHIISGGIICAWAMVVQKKPLPPLSELKKIFIMGFFLILMANAMLNWAELYIPTGLAAIMAALVPLCILVINLIFRYSEPINTYSIVGIIIGLGGVALIFYDNVLFITHGSYLKGIMLMLVSVMAWAMGTVYAKHAHIKTDAFFSTGLQMLMLGVSITMLSYFIGEFPEVKFTSASLGAVAYLVVFGSIIGYTAYVYSVENLPTTLVSVYAYINPIVAVVLGVVFLKENVNAIMLAAMGVTLLGVFLVNYGNYKGRATGKNI